MCSGGNIRETFERQDGAQMGFSECTDAIWDRTKLELKNVRLDSLHIYLYLSIYIYIYIVIVQQSRFFYIFFLSFSCFIYILHHINNDRNILNINMTSSVLSEDLGWSLSQHRFSQQLFPEI